MALGPLEYVVIGFEGNRFDGSIADEIAKVVEKRIIRIVDAVLITKDANGDAVIVEFDNKDDPLYQSFAPLFEDLMGLLTPDDVLTIAEEIPANTSALAIMFEHRWAEQIKVAMRNAGGFLVGRTTIAPEDLAALNDELDALEAEAAGV